LVLSSVTAAEGRPHSTAAAESVAHLFGRLCRDGRADRLSDRKLPRPEEGVSIAYPLTMARLGLAGGQGSIAHVQLRRPPESPSRATQSRTARRFRRSAHGRTYERICRKLCAAARLADRLRRVGRLRSGPAGASR